VRIEKRINEIVNRLNKTKEEKFPDLRAEREERDRKEREDQRQVQNEQRRREKEEMERKEKDKELRLHLTITCVWLFLQSERVTQQYNAYWQANCNT